MKNLSSVYWSNDNGATAVTIAGENDGSFKPFDKVSVTSGKIKFDGVIEKIVQPTNDYFALIFENGIDYTAGMEYQGGKVFTAAETKTRKMLKYGAVIVAVIFVIWLLKKYVL